jgi:chlorobactene glucosyltransferase
VIENPDLPAGWFGKQWACATGAAAARGEILLFADADTVHAPDLVTRAVHALRATGADLLSVSGRQELGSFWERAIQPQVFSILAGRYGGTEAVTNSRRVEDKIANGQCLMVRRDAYAALGGHAAVRDKVAEDLALAQRFFAGGRRVALFLGTAQLSTRMYTSLGELVRGWRKNVFAGGREAMPGGRVGRALFPALLLLPPLFSLVPVAALAAGLLGHASGAVLRWGALTTAAQLRWWAVVNRSMGQPIVYALAFPLGAAVLLGIMLQAIARGRRVEWKGRAYVAR